MGWFRNEASWEGGKDLANEEVEREEELEIMPTICKQTQNISMFSCESCLKCALEIHHLNIT